jgi:hypothetical protein
MPVAGEKLPEYPFGYGYCACGCGKLTKIVCGVPLKYFRMHHPRAREAARQRSRQMQISGQVSRRWVAGTIQRPLTKQQTAKQAVAERQTQARFAQVVAWTKANADFIRLELKKRRVKDNERARHYVRQRLERNPGLKLLAYVRGRIRAVLKRKGARKGDRTEKLLGCSAQELMTHLEAQFTEGMSWGNYGKWHVDHIKPCCGFDLTKRRNKPPVFIIRIFSPFGQKPISRKVATALRERKQWFDSASGPAAFGEGVVKGSSDGIMPWREVILGIFSPSVSFARLRRSRVATRSSRRKGPVCSAFLRNAATIDVP